MQGVHYALDTYYYYDDETDLISSVATTIGGSRRINYTYDSVWKDKLTSYDGHNTGDGSVCSAEG